MHYFTSHLWQPPRHSIATIILACIMGISIQSQLTLFILLIPIAALASILLIKNTQTIYHTLLALGVLFTMALAYEYQIQNHTLSMQQVAHINPLMVKIIDKEHLKHNRQYKEWLIAEVSTSHFELFPRKLYIYQTKESPWLPGDMLQIKNCRFPTVKNNDFCSFLCKENIAATLFLTSKNSVQLIHRPARSITRWLWQKRSDMLSLFEQHTSSAAFELASCIFWGNRTIIKQNPEIKESFKKIGIVHYLARSGLHLIVFMLIWQTLLKGCFLSYRKKRFILLLIGLIYFLLTWSSISFLRAFSLFIFFNIAALNRMRTNIFYLLCLACTIFLLCNPMQLFFLDFQLTFGLTCALVWHNHVEYQIKLETSQNH